MKFYTQNQGINYEETFSPVEMIKSIRIPLAICVFHDYEIWKKNLKIILLNMKLAEDVYMAQSEGCIQSKYLNRMYMLYRSIYGLKQAYRRWNICFDEKINKIWFLKK